MSRKKRLLPISFFLLALLLPLLAACGGEAATVTSSEHLGTTYEAPVTTSEDYSDFAMERMPGLAAMPTTAAAEAGVAAPASGDTASDEVTTCATCKIVPYSNVGQSPLTAGEVDDNAQFAAYLDYLNSNTDMDATRLDISERLYVRVTGSEQQPLTGALVQIYAGQERVFIGRTTSEGRVAFFPRIASGGANTQSYRVVVSAGGQSYEGKLDRGSAGADINLPVAKGAAPLALDLVFLLDATGSMGDEIAKIQSTIGSISERVEQLPGGVSTRFGLVAYRDRGEEYVTRSWDLTPNLNDFQLNLAQVEANGGGDTYEAVNAGLHDALALPGWQQGPETGHLRLLFLVGDAAPHLDYANDPRYPDLLNQAVAQGVKIFPIGASGLDDLGEYVFRQFAQITGGKFVFLTYANGVSGAPGVETRNHVEQFSVSNLDDLLVSLISGEVANAGAATAASNPAPVTVPNPQPVMNDMPDLLPAADPWATLGERLRPVWQGAQQWGWLALLGVIAFLMRRDRTRARVAAAPAATTTALGAGISPEATRQLLTPERVRVPAARDREQVAATLTAAPPQQGYVYRQGSDTSPLPPL